VKGFKSDYMLKKFTKLFRPNVRLSGRFTGCLLGQALGDALGFVVEGYPPEVCASYVRREMREVFTGQDGRTGFSFGQYSDDTQLARELLQSYAAVGYFDPADYARRIAAIFQEKRIVGRGTATENAAMRLQANIHWMDSGEPPPSAGNGAAMRAGVIGLLFYDNWDHLVVAAHEQSFSTHQDPRCSAGSIVIALTVGWVVTKKLVVAELLAELSKQVRVYDPILAAALLNDMPRWLGQTPGQAYGQIAMVGLTEGYKDSWHGISPFVTPSVLWSLYAFLRTPDDYWASLSVAIAVGGDVDTTAAMTGAMSGAYQGLSALPASVVKQVTDCGSWEFEQLCSLAESVCQQKQASMAV